LASTTSGLSTTNATAFTCSLILHVDLSLTLLLLSISLHYRVLLVSRDPESFSSEESLLHLVKEFPTQLLDSTLDSVEPPTLEPETRSEPVAPLELVTVSSTVHRDRPFPRVPVEVTRLPTPL
jgi:hypothetical protein